MAESRGRGLHRLLAGGRYLKRWPDPDQPSLTRYTAEPVEVSLVDHPCLPERRFALIKATARPSCAGSRPGAVRRRRGHRKAGARHSRGDRERIKQIHDCSRARSGLLRHAATLPVRGWTRTRSFRRSGEYGDGESGTAEVLAKAIGRLERPLVKALGAITARLDEMGARVKKIEDQPLPPRFNVGACRRKERGRAVRRVRSSARPARRSRGARRACDPQGAIQSDALDAGRPRTAGLARFTACVRPTVPASAGTGGRACPEKFGSL